MTNIRATCPLCGEVDMEAAAISLRVPRGAEEGAYAFICPECSLPVTKRASRKTVLLLKAAGVGAAGGIEPGSLEPTVAALSIEDRSPDPLAPALSLDDLIAFHFLLEDDVVLEELLSQRR